MPLAALPLEARDCPATWYGGEAWVGTHAVRVFPDWTGELTSLDAGPLRYVAPGAGGGPVVAVFDLRTGLRDRPDFFAADPDSRAGVVFVGADRPGPVFVPGVAPLASGPADGFAVFVDFEDHNGAEWERRVFEGIAAYTDPLGVRLTTVRPDAPAGTYGTVVIPADLTFFGADVSGLAVSRWDAPPADPWQPRVAFVGPLAASPPLAAVTAAHEIGHAFGLPHSADPRSVMYPFARPGAVWGDDLPTLRERVATAKGA